MEVLSAAATVAGIVSGLKVLSDTIGDLTEDDEQAVAHAVCDTVISNNDLAFEINESCIQESIAEYCRSCKTIRDELESISKRLRSGTKDRGLYDSVRKLRAAYGSFWSWHRTESNYASIALTLQGGGGTNEKKLAKSFVEQLAKLRKAMAEEVELIAERENLSLRCEDFDRLRETLVLPGENYLE